MRRLYLLRHAKSSWSDPDLADHDRPLSPRGEKDAGRVAVWLHRHDVAPQIILCSSSRRTRDTLAPIVARAARPLHTEVEDELYAASEDRLLARLRRLPDAVSSAMLIGHNPGIQDLGVALAAGGPPEAMARLAGKFPTAALATLELPSGSWRTLDHGAATLTDLLTPKRLARSEPRRGAWMSDSE